MDVGKKRIMQWRPLSIRPMGKHHLNVGPTLLKERQVDYKWPWLERNGKSEGRPTPRSGYKCL